MIYLILYMIIAIIVWFILRRLSIIDDFDFLDVPILAILWPLSIILGLIACIDYARQNDNDSDL